MCRDCLNRAVTSSLTAASSIRSFFGRAGLPTGVVCCPKKIFQMSPPILPALTFSAFINPPPNWALLKSLLLTWFGSWESGMG
ncbi:MAG: hypothetical protein RM338_13950 [Nostoc sp. DedQUE12a]|nr:hypothetical protein [Nostoc sp. DedQUE12a]